MPPLPEPRWFSVDRFEGDYAVVVAETGGSADMPRWLLPSGTREGDVVRVRRDVTEAGSRLVLRVDQEEGRRMREEAIRLTRRLGKAGERPTDPV